MPYLLLAAVLLSHFLGAFMPEFSPQQETPVLVMQEPNVDFLARRIVFQAQIQPAVGVSTAFLFLQPEGRNAEYMPLQVGSDGNLQYTLDLEKKPLRIFSRIEYAFEVELADGTKITGPKSSTVYADTRFTWQNLTDENFQVFYYDRGKDFGQMALNAAGHGLEAAEKLIPTQRALPIRIYIYLDPRDLQTAQQGLQPWAAGHAAPDLGMIFISIPDGPEQQLELERQLPHELVHILQYRVYGDQAKELPVWLVEGTASVAEFYQNPEYAQVLRTSAETNRLLSFHTLCNAFPRDAAGAFLAYAQSQSFVRYLNDTYGVSALTSLYQKYADGLNCAAGFESAYGLTINEAEYRWRLEALGLNPTALVLRNLTPYLLVFGLVFGAVAVTMVFATRIKR